MLPNQFRRFAHCFPEPLLLVSEQGQVHAANAAGCTLLGVADSHPLALTLHDCTGEDQNAVARFLHACVHSTAAVQARLYFTGVKPAVYMLCEGQLLIDQEQTPAGQRLLLLRCVADHKPPDSNSVAAAQAVYHQCERLVHVGRLSTMGELAAGIAHEINQPLTAIAAYAQAGRRLLAPTDTDTAELLDKINHQAQRAGQVIQRLRGMIRRRDSHRELCELNRLVQDTQVLTEADARLHRFHIRMRVAEQPLPVVVDPIQIQQVVINLIRNGFDAMLEAGIDTGVLTITTQRLDDDYAEVRVSDQGRGIPESLSNQLFTPFFTTKPQGIGLGLSISRSIVVSHGGRLGVAPKLDQGAALYFTLPLALDNGDV